VDRRRIFADDEDYETYTHLLAYVTERQGWHLLCYCLMPNHVHLLIETPETNLGNGIQLLHGRYAKAFNIRHDRVGHLFESPYKSPLVSDERLASTVAYIVANPVAAMLCSSADEWKWGSHALLERNREWLGHERLLTRLEEATGLRAYDQLVAGGVTLRLALSDLV
jgi:REP element-mobilizing transposase RayT